MPVDWERYRLRLVSAGLRRCEPGWNLDERFGRRLTDFDLWYVWAGRGSMSVDGQAGLLRPGVCFWMRPGHQYLAQQELSDRLGVTFVHFDLLDAAGRRIAESDLPPQRVQMTDAATVHALLRRVVDLATRSAMLRQPNWGGQLASSVSALPDDPHQEVAQAYLLAALKEYQWIATRPAGPNLSGTRLHHVELVRRLAQQIQEEPADTPPIAQFAHQSGYSPDHFTRVFKSVMGQSPQAFAVLTRIDRARQLLAETSLSVSQIAQMLGYDDVFFFSRQFKAKTGMTPTQCRAGR
jgi:AraC-like DNA-binding protein